MTSDSIAAASDETLASDAPVPLAVRWSESVESTGSGAEQEESLLANDAEHTLTSALAALKRKGDRAATTVEAALAPTRIVLGATLAVGLGALFLFAVVRRSRRPRRPRTLVGTVARSVAREVAGRLMLGAATAAGAHLAETVLVPLLVASISTRSARAARAPRPRKTKAPPAPT